MSAETSNLIHHASSVSLLAVALHRNMTVDNPNIDPGVIDEVMNPRQGRPGKPGRWHRRMMKNKPYTYADERGRLKLKKDRVRRAQQNKKPDVAVVAGSYDATEASFSSSGFMGKVFPKISAKQIISDWKTTTIYTALAAFTLLRFDPLQ